MFAKLSLIKHIAQDCVYVQSVIWAHDRNSSLPFNELIGAIQCVILITVVQ